MKAGGLLGRNFLKDTAGNAINAILGGASHNLRKILDRLRALLHLFPDEARKIIQTLCRYWSRSNSIRRTLGPPELPEGFYWVLNLFGESVIHLHNPPSGKG